MYRPLIGLRQVPHPRLRWLLDGRLSPLDLVVVDVDVDVDRRVVCCFVPPVVAVGSGRARELWRLRVGLPCRLGWRAPAGGAGSLAGSLWPYCRVDVSVVKASSMVLLLLWGFSWFT